MVKAYLFQIFFRNNNDLLKKGLGHWSKTFFSTIAPLNVQKNETSCFEYFMSQRTLKVHCQSTRIYGYLLGQRRHCPSTNFRVLLMLYFPGLCSIMRISSICTDDFKCNFSSYKCAAIIQRCVRGSKVDFCVDNHNLSNTYIFQNWRLLRKALLCKCVAPTIF